MSLTATHESFARRFHGGSGRPEREPLALRVFEWATVAIALVCMIFGFASSGSVVAREGIDVLAWLPVVIIADLMPVTLWNPVQITMSLPVLLAAAMVFPPFVAFLLGFIGNTDRREIRREISLSRGLFNRSNIGLSVFTASWLFHRTGGAPDVWPVAIGYAFLALAADMIVNNSLALTGAHLLFGKSISELLPDIYGSGQRMLFFLGYVCFGLMALLLASVYVLAGNWGLFAFIIPVILARQMFANNEELGNATIRLRNQQRAFASVSGRIADERRDERLSVAADLHDEVLPPLYKVHLMSQVVRQDLANGRLFELEEDLPGLMKAAEAANDAIRVLIRDLRRSSLGPHGLPRTLSMLAREVQHEFGVTIDTQLEDVAGTPITQLLAYQVAREAINNCVKHARSETIKITLTEEETDFRLVIEDDGRGFDVHLVDTDTHFGLQLMRERVELGGGAMVIDSAPGRGTRVVARFPHGKTE